jgi:hypothetical protein
MPPSFVWAPLIIKDFLCFLHLSPSVIPDKVIFQEKVTRLKKGMQMIYLALSNDYQR